MLVAGLGLRPTVAEGILIENLPFFDDTQTYSMDGTTYYPQQTTSTWRADWRAGIAGTEEHVFVDWSDNLLNTRWTANSVIRVETVLYQNPVLDPLDTMTGYTMTYLYGEGATEMYGADKTTTAPSGTSVSWSTKTAPWDSRSCTTCRLCTICLRT